MKTLHDAVNSAIRRAKKSGEERHIVYEAGEYDVCSDFDADTFYLGAPVLATAYPDGEIYYSDHC